MDIYSVPDWATATLYEKDSIVLQNNLYYYCKIRHTSATFATDLAANRWGGVLSYNGEQKPYFEWLASYGYRIPVKSLVSTIKFADGYAQDIDNSISNNLLTLNLQFNERDLAQTTAILHFLNSRKNQKFFFIPPAPYNVIKKFVCLEFDSGQEFYEKYNISATFEERI